MKLDAIILFQAFLALIAVLDHFLVDYVILLDNRVDQCLILPIVIDLHHAMGSHYSICAFFWVCRHLLDDFLLQQHILTRPLPLLVPSFFSRLIVLHLPPILNGVLIHSLVLLRFDIFPILLHFPFVLFFLHLVFLLVRFLFFLKIVSIFIPILHLFGFIPLFPLLVFILRLFLFVAFEFFYLNILQFLLLDGLLQFGIEVGVCKMVVVGFPLLASPIADFALADVLVGVIPLLLVFVQPVVVLFITPIDHNLLELFLIHDVLFVCFEVLVLFILPVLD